MYIIYEDVNEFIDRSQKFTRKFFKLMQTKRVSTAKRLFMSDDNINSYSYQKIKGNWCKYLPSP